MRVTHALLVLAGMAGIAAWGCDQGKVFQPAVAEFSTLAVAPTTTVVAVGAAYQLAATPLDQSGAPMSGLPAASFASTDSTIASVSATGLVTGVRAGTATITATLTVDGVTRSGDCVVTVSAAPPGPSVTTANFTFNPQILTIAAGESVTWQFSGATHNVTFTGAAPTGGNIPDQTPGNIVSRSFPTAGTYAYECTRHSGMTGQVVVTGAEVPVYTSLALTPAAPSLVVGGTAQLAATPLDQFGTAMAGLPAPTFASSDSATATVSAAGLVTGVNAGTATITASLTAGGVTKTATATVTVAAPPPSGGVTVTTPNLTFTPASVTIAVGETVTWQFSGATHNVTFLGAAPTGGNIPDQSPGNTVSRTFPTAGTYAYECTRHSGMSGQVVVAGAEAPVYTSLTVSPATPSLVVGGTVQLTATPLDQYGTPMTGLPAPSFASSDAATATVSAAGLVTAVKAGGATVTASLTVNSVTKSATAAVTVAAPPPPGGATVTTPNLRFTPATVTITAGGTVTWEFSGSTHNVTFTGARPPAGNIPDQSPGNTVSRTFPTAGNYLYECTRHSGMTGEVIVTGGGSEPPVLTSLAVTPATSSLLVAATVQLTATPLDQYGIPMTGFPAPSFVSSAPATATVSATGLVTAFDAGSATITASLTAAGVTKTGTATVTVTTAPSADVTVSTADNLFTPETVFIAPGGTVLWQFSGATHNVTFKDAAPPGGNIPNTAPGSAVTRTFPVAGDYDYECTRHSGMKGRVRVR
jgi:plastocyanin